MSFYANITYQKPSSIPAGKYEGTNVDGLYHIKEATDELENNVEDAKNKLDSLMKGWKLNRTDISYGFHGTPESGWELWYQRYYDK